MGMRAMWKGTVSFGLVTIPVKLYAATEQHDVSFRQVRGSDAARIRYKRVAETDGEEVPYADIRKGYELPSGEMLIITDEDLADLPLPSKRVVDVVEFVPLADIDPIYFNKSYYLEPEKSGLKPYALLRDTLRNTDMVAVVKVAISNREQLATLRVKDDVLVLATMLWPDEIRQPDFGFLDDDIAVRPQELAMAEALVNSMATTFDPSHFRDEFREALQEVLEAKMAGRAVSAAPATTDVAPVVDLMSALRASVDAAKAARTSSPPKPIRTRPRTAASARKVPSKAVAAAKPSKVAGNKAPAKRAPAQDRLTSQGGVVMDGFDLGRFVAAQDADRTYQRAISELWDGRKQSHWMWFVFPQIAGLGQSAASQRYAISSLEEARAYRRQT
jgi:DNA end-binding protein Ku